jgi:hypothetical protein
VEAQHADADARAQREDVEERVRELRVIIQRKELVADDARRRRRRRAGAQLAALLLKVLLDRYFEQRRNLEKTTSMR